MNNKAITPLISTLLLIIFAVGLGTMVMSWGNSDKFIKDSCKDTKLTIEKLNEELQLCFDNGNLKTILSNNGNTKIEGTRTMVLLSDSVKSIDNDDTIKPGEFKRIQIQTNIEEISKVLKIRIIPKLNNNPCVDQKVDTEKLTICK